MNHLKLQIIEGPNAGQELELDGPGVIGRDPAKSHLLLEDPEASRRHASLIPEGQSLNVEDLGSTNGTFVNGQRIADATVLVAGDRLRIGTSVLEVVLSPATAAEPIEEGEAYVEDDMDHETERDDEPRFAAVSGGSPEQPPADDPGGAPEPPATPPPPAGGATPAPDPGAGQQPGGDPGFAPPPPPAPPATASGGPLATQSGGAIKTRDSIVEWLLSAFVPFYSLYWLHRASKEMQEWSGGRIDYNATSTLLALTVGWIVIVPGFVALASFQGRVREAQRMAGVEQKASFGKFFLFLLLFGYGYKWSQDQFNEIAPHEAQG